MVHTRPLGPVILQEMGAMIPYIGVWVRSSINESETIAEPRLHIAVQWVITSWANSNWPSIPALSFHWCHISSLIVDHSHGLPLVNQQTSYPSKVYRVSWLVTCQNTWWVRLSLPPPGTNWVDWSNAMGREMYLHWALAKLNAEYPPEADCDFLTHRALKADGSDSYWLILDSYLLTRVDSYWLVLDSYLLTPALLLL